MHRELSSMHSQDKKETSVELSQDKRKFSRETKEQETTI